MALSRLRRTSVQPPQVAPFQVEGRIVLDGELVGEGFVDVDAAAGLVAGPVVAVLELRTAGEDILFGLGTIPE